MVCSTIDVESLIGQRLDCADKVIGRANPCRHDAHSQTAPGRVQLLPLWRGLGVVDVIENPDPTRSEHDLACKLHLFGRQARHIGSDPGDISTGPGVARHQTQMHRVGERGCHDRDRRRGVPCDDSLGGRRRQDDVGLEPDQLLCEGRQSFCIAVGESIEAVEVAALDVTEISHSLQKGIGSKLGVATRAASQPGDKRSWAWALRARNERPRSRRAAEQGDELSTFQSIGPHPLPPASPGSIPHW